VAAVFQEVSGIKMPGHKPVVGKNSFSYEAGIAAMFSYRLFKDGLPLGTVPYLPELVGGEFGIVLGKKAGKYNVLWHMERTGQKASEEDIREIVSQIKAKAIENQRAITDAEFDAIYNDVSSDP